MADLTAAISDAFKSIYEFKNEINSKGKTKSGLPYEKSLISDHLEKETIWDLLKVEEKIGVKLTESLAMWPAASVSGYYFANEEAKYFGLGKIKEDQVIDFAKRKGITKEKTEKWLQPNLAE